MQKLHSCKGSILDSGINCVVKSRKIYVMVYRNINDKMTWIEGKKRKEIFFWYCKIIHLFKRVDEKSLKWKMNSILITYYLLDILVCRLQGLLTLLFRMWVLKVCYKRCKFCHVQFLKIYNSKTFCRQSVRAGLL